MSNVPKTFIGTDKQPTSNIYFDRYGSTIQTVIVVTNDSGEQELAENDIIHFRFDLGDGYKMNTYVYDSVKSDGIRTYLSLVGSVSSTVIVF